MKLVIRIILGVIVIGALAAGGYWLYQTRFAPAPAATSFTQIVPVREGSLSNSLSVVGELDSTQSRELSFGEMDGGAELESLLVATGNTVKAGDVLATIDPSPYEQALDQARTDLQAAEQALADLQTPATSLEKAQADLAAAKADYDIQRAKQDLADVRAPDLTELEAAVVEAQEKLTRLGFDEKLAERDALAKKRTRPRLYDRLVSTQNQPVEKQRPRKTPKRWPSWKSVKPTCPICRPTFCACSHSATWRRCRTAPRSEPTSPRLPRPKRHWTRHAPAAMQLDLAKAELAIQQAQVALTQAQEERTALDTGADPTDLAAAQADVDKKRLAVSDAEAALAATELKAPFDGTILETNVRVGNKITASTVVMTIANLDEMQVYAAVDETTIRRITKGQEAQISFDAFPGQSFKGTVLDVPLQGTLQNDVMVYQVPLSLEGAKETAAAGRHDGERGHSDRAGE